MTTQKRVRVTGRAAAADWSCSKVDFFLKIYNLNQKPSNRRRRERESREREQAAVPAILQPPPPQKNEPQRTFFPQAVPTDMLACT